MKKCIICGIEKNEDEYDFNGKYRRKYCKLCRCKKNRTGRPPYRIPKGTIPWNKGKKLTEEQKKNTGSKPGWKHTEDAKSKISKAHRGKGTSRLSWNFKEWRRKVFERDAHQCQTCGSTEKLHPHHIVPFEESFELRFEVSNGKTMCMSCHAKLEGFQKGHISWKKGKKFPRGENIKCSKCEIIKKINEFGRGRICKMCLNKQRRERRLSKR